MRALWKRLGAILRRPLECREFEVSLEHYARQRLPEDTLEALAAEERTVYPWAVFRAG